MPVITALPLVLSLLNKSRQLYALYGQLPAEQQQQVRGQAESLVSATTDASSVLQRRRGARERLLRLERAVEAQAHPGPGFELAQSLFELLRAQGAVPLLELDRLAQALGAEDANDPDFMDALRVASADGRVSVALGHRGDQLVATTSASLGLAVATEIEERAMVAHLETAGAADVDALARAAGAMMPRDRVFQLALARVLERGEVQWLASRTYGLSRARVDAMLRRERGEQVTFARAVTQLSGSARELASGMQQLAPTGAAVRAELGRGAVQPPVVPALEPGTAHDVELSDAELADALASLCSDVSVEQFQQQPDGNAVPTAQSDPGDAAPLEFREVAAVQDEQEVTPCTPSIQPPVTSAARPDAG